MNLKLKMRAYIFGLLCVSLVRADTYTAGVVQSNTLTDVVQSVYKAGANDVDILLATGVIGSEDNYDQTLKSLSQAANNANLYLVANVNERILCQNKHEVVRSNIVFDRDGAIVSINKKSTSPIANCTSTPGLATFSSDFGVTFGVMMEEDMVLKNSEELKEVKNFLVAGAWSSEIPFLSASQLSSSWAYSMEANLISSTGIFAAKSGLKTGRGAHLIAQLNNDAQEPANPPVSPGQQPSEDLGQYTIRPLRLDGDTQELCHDTFCCRFHVKASFRGPNQDVNYGIAAFDGARLFANRQFVGIQSCAVFACAGLYKRSCTFGSVNNNTNLIFEELTITANFAKRNSIQYPIISSNNAILPENFAFTTKNTQNTKEVTIHLKNNDNILAFGIFGRDFANDYVVSTENSSNFYDYIFNEDVQEFFDYIWIRLRILIFIVSIYVLEMM